MREDDPRTLEQRADRCAERGDHAAATAFRERAYAGWRARGDLRRAAYLAAYRIAFDHAALFGNSAVAQGWLERGTHLAEQAGECAEAGWVALSRALFATDPETRAELVAEATRLARRFGDGDLEFDALAYAGLARVERGAITEGMRQLDEAAAAVRGGEVADPVAAGEIYCKLLAACECSLDVRRAEEWQAAATTRAGDDPALSWVSAICRTHYGGILLVAGRWSEAERELEESLRLYDAGYRALRSASLARLAELRVRQGRLAEARTLLDGVVDGYAERARARLDWLAGRDREERDEATARLQRALEGRLVGPLDVPVLAALTEMQVARGDLAAAERTARTVAGLAATDPVDALVGYARLSHARVVAAAGADGTPEAVVELQSAASAFAAARLPLETAGARLALGELLRAEDPGRARTEAREAAEAFAWLGARDGLDRATALLRDLGGSGRPGVRRVGGLTDREAEVLALVAQGLSNGQIAERLYISRKTASHHVSHVLTKLGVRTRAEAAAWAAARGRTSAR